MLKIEYKVAKSGEVFYVYNGELHVADNMDEYEKFVKQEEKIKTTFFEFTDGTSHYKYNIASHKSIMFALKTIKDLDKKVDLLLAYTTLRKEVYGE